MEKFVKETLERQMGILSERSVRENGEYLAPITAQMIELAKILDPELREPTFKWDYAPLQTMPKYDLL